MEIVRYSLLRLGLLLGSAALLYLAGMRGALLWLVAIVVAFLLAFILFPRTGDAAAQRLKEAVQRTGHAGDTHEDEALEAEPAEADGAAAGGTGTVRAGATGLEDDPESE